MKSRERVLFFSIWILIFIGLGIWKLWPSQTSSEFSENKAPEILLGNELGTIFTGASVLRQVPTQFTVSLKMHPDYLNSLTSTRELDLTYQLEGSQSVLTRSRVHAVLLPQKDSITIELANPHLVTAHRIRLFLGP